MLTAWIALIMNSLFVTLRLGGGGGSFPRPLKAEEERMYLERFAAGDMEARNVLIEHNLRLVAHIIKKEGSERRQCPGKKRPRRGRQI
jgi:RNA polymerase sporulation-specific sigma factor